MAGRQRYSQDRVIGAIDATRGLVTLAARQLGCEPRTVTNYVHRYPRVREALQAARARQLDVAEAQLFRAIDAGEPWAVQFYLRTVGRIRGYGDRIEVDATVDVLHDPGWLRTRTALLGALLPFPQARMAVADALAALEAPRDDGDAGAG